MQKIYHFKNALFLFVFFGFFSCSGPDKKTADNERVIAQADQQNAPSRDYTYSFEDESQKFIIQNSKPREIHLPSGTLIKIPANCFVDENGNNIKGDVDLSFEEFLSPGSIIASQINMKYDSAGKVSNFESAGMFRINAYKDSKEVFIAKNKSIGVDLATSDTDKNFNAYYSTKNGDDWKYLDKSSATENTLKQEEIAKSTDLLNNNIKPLQPLPYSANGKYFDLNLNRTHTRDLKSLLGVVWEYAGADKKNDPAVSKTNFNRNWDYVSILPADGDKRGVYEITLQDKDTTIKTVARPVFRGAVLDAESELFAKELGEFNTRMEQAKNEQKQALAESSFLRTIQVKNLGLYNYDRQYHAPDMTPVYANFNFGADSLKNYPISVYLITGNGLAVIKYPPHDWTKFAYSRKDINKMIAILPNQEICTFSATRFKKEGPVFPENAPGNFTFKLNHTGIKATNSKNIDQVLNTI